MAAPVNLPVSSKASPSPSTPVEKVSSGASDSGSANGANHSGFSQVLHHQMDKQQPNTAKASSKPAAKTENTDSKQSVAKNSPTTKPAQDNSQAEAKPAAKQQAKAQTAAQSAKPQAADPAKQQDQAKADSTAAAMAAAMQTQAPVTPMPQLRELVAASLHGNGQNGNNLPLEANAAANGASAGGQAQADMMKLLALRTATAANGAQQAQPAGANSVSGQAMAGLPQQLQLLEQRIQKQIALEQNQTSSQASGAGADTGNSGGAHLDIKQLQGLENALQSLAKANSQGDTKGMASAWDQLNNRLQQLQLSQDGSNNDSTDGLSGMLKSLKQEMATLQQSVHLHAGQSDKTVRLAFQEMLGKLGAQQQLAKPPAQSANITSIANSAATGGGAGVSQSQAQPLAPAPQAASTTVNVPVHNQAWGQAIGERLQWMVKQDMKHAEIKLNPRHLGPIEVKIAMNQDQATVSFSAHHVVTKEALETALPKLREMFGDNGLNLLDVNVSHHSGSEGQQANTNSQQGGQSGGGNTATWSPFDSSTADALMTDVRTPQWFGSNRMLDTYV